MGFMFGGTDTGYRPEQQATSLGNQLYSTSAYQAAGMTPAQAEQIYQSQKGGKWGVNWGDLSTEDQQRWLAEQATTKMVAEKPQFTYKPGESGVDVRGKEISYTPTGYQGFQFSAPKVDLKTEANPYYESIKANAVEAAKTGTQSALNQAANVLGRRGIARTGIGQQQLGTIAATSGQNIANISRDIDFQRANQLSQLGTQQQLFNAQAEAERQARQAGEQQFGAQFGNQQQQFLANLGMQQREAALRENLAQQDLDRAYRAEKLGMYNQPYSQLSQLYGQMAPMAARDVQNKGLLNYAGDLGGAVFGGAQAYGAVTDQMNRPSGSVLGGGYGTQTPYRIGGNYTFGR